MSTLRVFTFGPANGLPTAGPFGLKLEMALRMAGVPYERVYEDDHRKGPKRKSPWIEKDGTRMGDTSLILPFLGVDLDAHLSALDRARGMVLRRMLEEHWHQCFEYELFVHPAGYATFDALVATKVPALVAPLAAAYIRRLFRNHLFERGIARHTVDEVTRMGIEDLEALSDWMEGREWAVGDRPSLTDCSAFGLLAPAIWSPAPTPCYTRAKELRVLVDYTERMRARWFPEAPAWRKVAAVA
jgi:glutathione S-transferase